MKKSIISPVLFIFISFVLVNIFGCEGCKEPVCDDPLNPECPNYDPCLSYEPANADFVVMDTFTWITCLGEGGAELFISEVIDTSVVWGDKHFKALYQNDTYRWKIGYDTTVWIEKEFDLYFGNAGVGDIPITLITTKNDPNHCLTEAEMADTITKTIHLVNWEEGEENAPRIFGRYVGVETDYPLDTFIVEISTDLLKGVLNLPNGCTNEYGSLVGSWKSFLFSTGWPECNRPCGKGQLQEDNKTLIVDYTIKIENKRLKKQFIGIKIN